MEKVIHRAASRGFADHGWLRTYHTFSYENYYDPRRIHFGALRVINEDIVEGGEGFPSRPHENMEIIVLPLEGAIEHGDNIGNITVVNTGDIQVMTTGTGIIHNEYNKSQADPVKTLQVWVYPREYDTPPSYSKVSLLPQVHNGLRLIVAPDTYEKQPGVASIAQDVWFYTAEVDEGTRIDHVVHGERNGVYFFVIDGTISVGETQLGPKDGLGIWDMDSVSFTAGSPAKVLLMEVPMRKEQI